MASRSKGIFLMHKAELAFPFLLSIPQHSYIDTVKSTALVLLFDKNIREFIVFEA